MMAVLAVLALFFPLAAAAQDSYQRLGTYRIFNSYELGYRSVFVAGNRQMYRSTINHDNGLRLLEGLLRLHSGDGHGRYFDEIVIATSGSGGDPYQANSLRLEKNRFFRLDLGFRIVRYSNQLLSLSSGEHRQNTERTVQNYDLTLFPQSRVQLLLGFERNNQSGPAISSENIDVRREEAFPRERFFVFADDVRRRNHVWRAGANVTGWGIKYSFLQGWDDYQEETRHSQATAETAGLLPAGLRRADPVSGRTPFTRFNVHTDANRSFSVNGRFVYAGGDRSFVLDESISSLNPVSGVAVTRQAFVVGRARRNQGTGDLTVSYQPGERWTLSNTTSVNLTRINGDSSFLEVRQPIDPRDPGVDTHFFNLLRIRLIANASDLNFRLSKKVGLYAGYHYSTRRIESRDSFPDAPLYSFDNATHAGLAGVRLRPRPPLTLLFDIEYGRADRPFTPVSEKHFHAETVKAQWKHKAWVVTGSFKTYYNRNSAPPILAGLEGGPAPVHSYESRQYSASVAWAPPRRVALDAGYARLALDTASGILNFPAPGLPPVVARRSLYQTNLHHAHGTLRVDLRKNVALSLGYLIVKDTAEGSNRRGPAIPFASSYPNLQFDGADLVNAYPLSYQSPQARLTLILHEKISWNAGWQFYKYAERFSGLQNYHAHLGYTSLRWGF